MATTIVIVCPECKKEMKAPAELEGKKIRCKGCGSAVPVKATAAPPSAKAAAPPKPAKAGAASKKPVKPKPAKKRDDDLGDGKPYDVTTLDLAARCPNCANEMEDADAIICLTCGYNTRTRQRAQTRRVHDTTAGDYFLWLLPGIACALGVIALIVIDVLYCLKVRDWLDQESWYGAFLSHKGVQLWLVLTSLFTMYPLTRFAIRRLIFNPHPPEVERYK